MPNSHVDCQMFPVKRAILNLGSTEALRVEFNRQYFTLNNLLKHSADNGGSGIGG